MKKTYLKLFLKNKILVFVLLLTNILLGISILFGTYEKTIYKECFDNSNNSESYRTISFSFNDINEKNINSLISKIKKIDNVLDVFDIRAYIDGGVINDFKNNTFSGLTELHTASNNTLPSIYKGTNFPDDDNYYMICPTVFFPGSSNLSHTSRLLSIDLTNEIGNSYNYVFDNKTNSSIDIKLIGLYKPSSYDTDEERACYTNEKTLKDIYNENLSIRKENCLKECLSDCDEECNLEIDNSYVIIVDDKTKKSSVINKLSQFDVIVDDTSSETLEYVNEFYNNRIKHLRKYFKAYLVLFSILVTLLNYFIINFLVSTSFDLRLFGYTKHNIRFYNFFIIVFNIISNICLSFIILLFIKVIIKFINYLYPLIFEKFLIIFDYSYYYQFVLVYVLLMIISLIISNILIGRRIVYND